MLLAIDAGTTSSRAIIFDLAGQVRATHQIEFAQHYPNLGWVEHDPEDIWQTTLMCIREVLSQAKLSARDINAIGISNQRETTVIWERETGMPIYPAIVWQDRRTADRCAELKLDNDLAAMVIEKTGLLLDPYFSATKIAWILDHIAGARLAANKGQLAFGTIDTFLLWRLTGGKAHKTDITNASRTLLFNIGAHVWDEDLLKVFDIPRSLLPEVGDCAEHFAMTDETLFGAEIPITGIAGDQQAAAIGQACFESGDIKITYGTGSFLMLNTGSQRVRSTHRLLTTIAYRLGGKTAYALEGSNFNAGTAIQWLRDELGIIATAKETSELASDLTCNDGVYFVPAFTGLGAPYWVPDARGAIFGLTRNTNRRHLVRAALEAVAYQTRDLITAMQADYPEVITGLRVDGGMAANDWLLQFLSEQLQSVVMRPQIIETSALGAAMLAGLGAGLFESFNDLKALWQADRSFTPKQPASSADACYRGWQHAISLLTNSVNKF